ncbi:MAG: hypothetical protein L3K17_10780, partial [Thermoplasmata archaeon]|nr:hypothetical protein [Thermoplasmata archaeon]
MSTSTRAPLTHSPLVANSPLILDTGLRRGAPPGQDLGQPGRARLPNDRAVFRRDVEQEPVPRVEPGASR